VLKSDITPSTVAVDAATIRFSYSDQVNFTVNHNYNFYDCEAFFYLNDSIHLFTKGWVNKWTKHYVLPADTGNQVAQLVDSFNVGGLVTSAAIQGDSLVALLGLNFSGNINCFVWMLSGFQDSHFFSGNKRKFNIGSPYTTGQTEAICFTDTNRGYITNERISIAQIHVPAQLREFDLNPYLEQEPSVPVITIPVNVIYQNLQACFDSGNASFTVNNISAQAGQDLYFSIGGLPPWLTATPVADTVAPGDSAVITLNFASGILAGGTYVANASVQSNDPYHPAQNISITLEVDSNPCMDFGFSVNTCTGLTSFTSDAVNNPTAYYWDFGDGGTSGAVNPSHVYAAGGNYIATLIGCNAAGCDTVIRSIQVQITGQAVPACQPVTQSYCCGIGITNVHISGPAGDVFNNGTQNAIAGYEDHTCQNPGIMSTNIPYLLNCRTGIVHPEYLKIWLDMNNDGIFDSASEQLFSDFDTMPPIHSGVITIPVNAGNVYGMPIRMRVASDYQQEPQPCLNPQFGQHEDYSVILNLPVEVKEELSQEGFSVYPNPFGSSTNIDYTVMQPSIVSLDIFNVFGERVERLVDSQVQEGGKFHYQFSGYRAGVYFVRLSVNNAVTVAKTVKII
jgi:hypothetical protein